MDLNQMIVFVRVVQAGSLSAAAREMRMPKSTVSRKVAELEERLETRLLQRTTRTLGLTDAGRIYFERAARIVAEVEETEQAVGGLQAAPRGLLRVTAPLSFGALGPIVAEYLAQHPDVQVEVVCTDRQVDLVEERFDVAVRAGRLADSALVARKLGTIERVLVASPAYCDAHGAPQEPRDLVKHSCIAFAVGATPDLWTLESETGRSEIRIRPRLSVNDADIMRDAALAGAGIAWLPAPMCGPEVRRGRLRRVLPEWRSAEVPVHAVYPTARHLSPKSVAFIDVLAKRLRLHF